MEEVNRRLDDHEGRLRVLEENKYEVREKLLSIEKDIALQGKSIAELKSSIIESNEKLLDKQDKNQKMVEDILKSYLERDIKKEEANIEIIKINNKNKWATFKEFIPWIIGTLGVLTAFMQKIVQGLKGTGN